MTRTLRSLAGGLRRALRRATRPAAESLTTVREPASRVFGLDRGRPVDRHYIEAFLAAQSGRIRGSVLEVGESTYTRRFGGDRVQRADALIFGQAAEAGRLAGDLTDPASLPERQYDCFICTQTFNFIFDVGAAVRGAHRLLKPGGALLATVAGISPISRWDLERWGDYWRFTPLALEKLLGTAFGSEVEVRARGNLLAATAFLHGLAIEDLEDPAALEPDDADYPVIVTAVARRAP